MKTNSTAGTERSLIGATPPRWLIFGIVAIAIFMSTMDSTIVATALLNIHRSLHSSINWAGWTITIYSLGLVIALPAAGRLSDEFGRRRVFMIGVVIFTVSSLLCGFSSNIYMLISFRALQAIGGGTLTPSATGIVSDHFGRGRDRAIGMFGTIATSGQVVGPVLGGLIVGFLSWRWIFYVNVPLGAALVILIVIFIPESRHGTRSPIDFPGLFLLGTFLLTANFGITMLGEPKTSFFDPLFVVPELVSLCLLSVYIIHSARASSPIIPLRLLRDKGFAVMNTITFLWGVTGFGVASLVPLYAEQRYHLGALSAATLLTARGVGATATGIVAALLLRRTGYRLPMIIGYSVVSLGTLLMSFSPLWGLGPYAWLSIAACCVGLGTGFGNPASRNATLHLSPDDVAAISGLRQMFLYIGIIFSVSIVSAILARSSDPGVVQAHVYWVISAILVGVMVPLVFRVSEHKGSW